MRLESVPRCPVCGDAHRQLEQSDVRDGAFGAAPGVWRLQRCLGCRALYLDPRDGTAGGGFVNAMKELPGATGSGGVFPVFLLP